MGQTIRQTMPFNARYAFLQAGKDGRYSQQSRAFPTQVTTYPSTIGVCPICCVDRLNPQPIAVGGDRQKSAMSGPSSGGRIR